MVTVPWWISGSYLEACNCEAICPCRRIDGKVGARSTYGECLGALSWLVLPTRTGAVRLSDADRERAVGALKDHYAAGRLSTGELEVRVEDVYRSSTRSELAPILRDLPLRGRQLIVRRVRGFQRAFLRMHLLTYATANASLVGIWELAGQGIFWPALFLIPSTALVAGHVAISRMLTRALGRIR